MVLEPTSPSLQRSILKLVQTNGPMERSELGRRSRSTDQDNWAAVLDDLVDRGLITESAVIRVGANSRRGQKRAVITYQLGNAAQLAMDTATSVPIVDLPLTEGPFTAPYDFPNFADLSSEEVHQYVDRFPRRTAEAIAS
jgi:hypothetical protein